jgi:replicative DNA helicase
MSAGTLAAERALLGALLADDEAFARVEPILQEKDFSAEVGRACWRAAGRLARLGVGIDLVSLSAELERVGDLGIVGGAGAVAALAEGLPDTVNVEHYAALVKRAAIKRELGMFAGWLGAKAGMPEGDGEELGGESVVRLAGIVGHNGAAGTEDAGAIAARELKRIEAIGTDGPNGLPLGFPALDRILAGGLEPGALAIIAARPGVGKTALLANVALKACDRGLRAMLFSLEMPREAIARRLVATLSRVPLTNLRTGQLNPEEWKRLAAAQDRLSGMRLVIDDTPALTTDQVLARARRRALVGGVDLVLVDYLGKIAARGENRTAAVGAIARGLKDAARSLSVPVIAAAQLSRLNVREDRPPALSDLRDSGEIEQEADVVLLLHSVAADVGARVVQVVVAKHLNGPTGECKLIFNESTVGFSDYGQREVTNGNRTE